MSITGYIISGLLIIIFAILTIGSMVLNAERKEAEREKDEIRKERAENAKHTAQTIEQANKDKNEVRTGDHGHDLRTMADKLHDYANRQ